MALVGADATCRFPDNSLGDVAMAQGKQGLVIAAVLCRRCLCQEEGNSRKNTAGEPNPNRQHFWR